VAAPDTAALWALAPGQLWARLALNIVRLCADALRARHVDPRHATGLAGTQPETRLPPRGPEPVQTL